MRLVFVFRLADAIVLALCGKELLFINFFVVVVFEIYYDSDAFINIT